MWYVSTIINFHENDIYIMIFNYISIYFPLIFNINWWCHMFIGNPPWIHGPIPLFACRARCFTTGPRCAAAVAAVLCRGHGGHGGHGGCGLGVWFAAIVGSSRLNINNTWTIHWWTCKILLILLILLALICFFVEDVGTFFFWIKKVCNPCFSMTTPSINDLCSMI